MGETRKRRARPVELIGNYLSPYVRRVAVSLRLLELPFELNEVFVFASPEAVRAHNPVTRIPTLLLDDGEALVDSAAILDALDDMVPPERALIPRSGAQRRQVMKITALGMAACEKAQWMFYEKRFRPEEKVHEPWLAHNREQVLAGLGYLNDLARQAGDGWLAGTAAIGQADVTAAVTTTFAHTVHPTLGIPGAFAPLWSFTSRCEALEAFTAAPIPDLPD